VRFYLKGFYETILAYAKVRLLLVTKKRLFLGNIHLCIPNLTSFLQKEGIS
jgi:hypothetical protein